MKDQHAVLIAAAILSATKDCQFYQDSEGAAQAAYQLLETVHKVVEEREAVNAEIDKNKNQMIAETIASRKKKR